MKKYYFNQDAGLGDIMFIMAIAQKWHEEGHTIIWPTAVHYHLHQKNFPEVKFIPEDQFFLFNHYDLKSKKEGIFEDDNYKVFPFMHANLVLNGGKWAADYEKTCMQDKYDMVGLPMDMWRTFKITRDYEMEDKLFKSLGLGENEEFNLINENQTRIFQKTKIEVNNGLRNVYMNRDDPQYNMLDWLKVIYKAKTLHTVVTAQLVLFERLDDLPAVEKHLYKRIWDTDYKWCDSYITHKNYILH